MAETLDQFKARLKIQDLKDINQFRIVKNPQGAGYIGQIAVRGEGGWYSLPMTPQADFSAAEAIALNSFSTGISIPKEGNVTGISNGEFVTEGQHNFTVDMSGGDAPQPDIDNGTVIGAPDGYFDGNS